MEGAGACWELGVEDAPPQQWGSNGGFEAEGTGLLLLTGSETSLGRWLDLSKP